VRCEFRSEDWKRAPISQEYVAALEGRIAALESLLSSIKTTAGHHREAIIQGIHLEDHLSMTSMRTYPPMVSFDDGENIVPDNCWSKPEEGILSSRVQPALTEAMQVPQSFTDPAVPTVLV